MLRIFGEVYPTRNQSELCPVGIDDNPNWNSVHTRVRCNPIINNFYLQTKVENIRVSGVPESDERSSSATD